VIQAAVGAKALVGGVECGKDTYTSISNINTEVFFKDIQVELFEPSLVK
jgi:hypothetical protein